MSRVTRIHAFDWILKGRRREPRPIIWAVRLGDTQQNFVLQKLHSPLMHWSNILIHRKSSSVASWKWIEMGRVIISNWGDLQNVTFRDASGVWKWLTVSIDRREQSSRMCDRGHWKTILVLHLVKFLFVGAKASIQSSFPHQQLCYLSTRWRSGPLNLRKRWKM